MRVGTPVDVCTCVYESLYVSKYTYVQFTCKCTCMHVCTYAHINVLHYSAVHTFSNVCITGIYYGEYHVIRNCMMCANQRRDRETTSEILKMGRSPAILKNMFVCTRLKQHAFRRPPIHSIDSPTQASLSLSTDPL